MSIEPLRHESAHSCGQPGVQRQRLGLRRELGEEASLAAARWDHLGSIVTIPSFCDERIELYLARELSAGAGSLDF